MNINQVHSFTIYRFEDGIVTKISRNPFGNRGDSDAFRYQQVDRRGGVIRQFTIALCTAEASLRKALELRHSRPDLISVEITKLSTGTCFNYPIPHV
jgi:hypothetical protein